MIATLDTAPPVAEIIPHEISEFGKKRVDNYFWLKEKTNPKVIDYLKAENEYAAATMKPTAALQDTLYKEILGRIVEDDQDVPIFDNGYWYYSRTEKGKAYPIHCRRKDSMSSPEEVVIDENDMAKGQAYFDLGSFEVSDDNNMLAYSVDMTGFREYQGYVMNLDTRKVVKALGKVDAIEWAADNQTLFYVTEDESKRWNKVWRAGLTETPAELVYEEKDIQDYLSISRSHDRKFLFLSSESKETSEVRFLKLDNPTAKPTVFLAKKPKTEYSLEHRDGWFYVRINDTGRNFRLVKTPVDKPDKRYWKQLLAHSKKVLLNAFVPFQDYSVLLQRANGFSRVSTMDAAGKVTVIEQPELVADVGLSSNPDFNSPSFRYSYVSYTTPGKLIEHDVTTGKEKLLKQQKVLGGFKASDYRSELLYAKAKDGTLIPVSLVVKKSTPISARTPLLLYGYGSYGSSTDPWFSNSMISLLDRGMIFAVAHVRGGGEMGTEWYDRGKLQYKMNTFTDFIACADMLCEEKYTSHERMAMRGGSAGGLLMGAVLNLRPDLVKTCIAEVPFVDVLNTMEDETLPLTTAEYLEWGNPKVKKEFGWMAEYSPYDNVRATDYPNILVMTSLNDSQVMYHEPAKWTAKLRAMKTDHNKLVLKVNMDAGHGGASGRYDSIKESAYALSFILWTLGINR